MKAPLTSIVLPPTVASVKFSVSPVVTVNGSMINASYSLIVAVWAAASREPAAQASV